MKACLLGSLGQKKVSAETRTREGSKTKEKDRNTSPNYSAISQPTTSAEYKPNKRESGSESVDSARPTDREWVTRNLFSEVVYVPTDSFESLVPFAGLAHGVLCRSY